MASYTIAHTNTSVTFNVYELSNGDVVRFYVRYDPDPGDTIYNQTYTADGSTMSRSFTILPNRDYAVNCKVNSGAWIGAKYFQTGSIRPSNWSWGSGLVKGSPIELTASEWNNFLNRVNKFREYKGLSNYSFTSAVSGQPMTVAQVNQAWTAINEISGHGTLPTAAVKGKTIYASFFTQLAVALNAIS